MSDIVETHDHSKLEHCKNHRKLVQNDRCLKYCVRKL